MVVHLPSVAAAMLPVVYRVTGWMMWNFLASSLLCGVVPVLYDGHPAPSMARA